MRVEGPGVRVWVPELGDKEQADDLHACEISVSTREKSVNATGGGLKMTGEGRRGDLAWCQSHYVPLGRWGRATLCRAAGI